MELFHGFMPSTRYILGHYLQRVHYLQYSHGLAAAQCPGRGDQVQLILNNREWRELG